MIGSSVDPLRLQDWRPIRTLHAVLLAGFLIETFVALGYAFLVLRFGVTNRMPLLLSTVAFSFVLTVGYAQLLGGVRKVWSDWSWRNYHGFDYILWQKKPNELESTIQPTPSRTQAWWQPAWRLCIPLGGWFAKPVILHGYHHPSANFSIIRVKWDHTGTVESVTVEDCNKDRITVHPAVLLRFLNEQFPDGEMTAPAPLSFFLYKAFCDAAEHHEKMQYELTAEHDSRVAAQARCEKLDEQLRLALDDIGAMLVEYDRSSRLKNQREAQRLIEGASGFLGLRLRLAALEANRLHILEGHA